jgi:hypothetical protein
MKTTTLLYFVPVAAFAVACTSTQTDYSTWRLKGKVKVCTEKWYEAEEKFGTWEPGDLSFSGKNFCIRFDENGQYTEIDHFNRRDKLEHKVIPKRENGSLTEELEYDDDGKLEYTHKVTYISDNEKIIKRYYNDKKKRFRDETRIKELENRQTLKNGRVIRNITSYNNNEGIVVIDTITYDYVETDSSFTTAITGKAGVIFYERQKYLEFDKHNNWTKALVYRCEYFSMGGNKYTCEDAEKIKEPEYIAVRQIEYY